MLGHVFLYFMVGLTLWAVLTMMASHEALPGDNDGFLIVTLSLVWPLTIALCVLAIFVAIPLLAVHGLGKLTERFIASQREKNQRLR
jgi:hypothetical protein